MNNLDIIKRLYNYFAKGNTDAIRNIFDDNIEWKQMDGFPNGGHYIGADDIFKNVFSGFKEHWTGWGAHINEFIEAESDVFAIGYYQGTFNSTQRSMKAEFIHRYTLNNGKVVRFTQYTDTKLVADAMS